MSRAALLVIAFAVVFSLSGLASWGGPIAYSVCSNGDDHLYSIDLNTGIATDLGLISFGDAEGLAFAGNTLYAIGGTEQEFWNITSPPGFKVGDTGTRDLRDAGLAYDYTTGIMYNLNGGSANLYTVNLATGATTYVGASPLYGDSLAISLNGVAYTADWIYANSLYRVDLATAALTLVGGLGASLNAQAGMDFDSSGVLWAIANPYPEAGDRIYRINTATGAATFVANVTVQGAPKSGFEGLAIQIPEPAGILVLINGVAGLFVMLRKRRS